MKTIGRRTGLVFAAVLCMIAAAVWSVLPVRAAAEQGGSGSILIEKDSDELSSSIWLLFRVGGYTDSGFVSVEDFSGSTEVREDMTAEELAAAAQTLAETAKERGASYRIAVMNESGQAYFGGLTDGVYLVAGADVKIGDRYYGAVPSVVNVDGSGKVIYPKFGYKTKSGFREDELTPDDSSSTPDTPVVDGGKKPDYPTDGGKSSSHTPTTPGVDKPHRTPTATPSADTPTGTGSGIGTDGTGASNTALSATATANGVGRATDLTPGTGQVWWPVPAAAALGALCVCFGTRLLAGRDDDEDEE